MIPVFNAMDCAVPGLPEESEHVFRYYTRAGLLLRLPLHYPIEVRYAFVAAPSTYMTELEARSG